jgi:hypothetical protein
MKMMKVLIAKDLLYILGYEIEFLFFLEMRDFIVDDDDEHNNGFDYRKELHETLKTNFRFDKEK